MALTLAAMAAKRKKLWRAHRDLTLDGEFTAAAAQKILSEPALIRAVRADPGRLIEIAFTLVNKNGATVPFFLNEVQADFLSQLRRYGTARPYFILKGRQQGFTTLITALQLAHAITRHNFAGMTVADRADNTRAIFNDKGRAMYQRLPAILRPTEKFNSASELVFSKLGSSWRTATASEQAGRSRTLSFLHFSEVAFFDCPLSALQAGIGEAAAPDALIIYETTANGFNEAKKLWDSGTCVNLFYPFWRTAEYRSADLSALAEPDAFLRDRLALLKSLGLSAEQCAWYAAKYRRYLEKPLIRQEYPISPEEAFLSFGDCLFDREALLSHLLRLGGTPGTRGRFRYTRVCDAERDGSPAFMLRDVTFCPDASGLLTLHEPPRPGASYVLGGDTAGEGADYYTGKMIEAGSGRTVATLRVRQIDEDLYAEQMLCLALHYNGALIAIETNYSRHPLRVIGGKYGYRRLYRREKFDRLCGGVTAVPGFLTTSATKPLILQELMSFLREHPDAECDAETLRELSAFVRKPNGRMEACGGSHDDLVMALAIAHHAAAQAAEEEPPPQDDEIGELFEI